MSVLVSVFVHEVPINLSCTYAFPAYTNLKAASLKKRGEEKEKEGEDIKRYLMKKKKRSNNNAQWCDCRKYKI